MLKRLNLIGFKEEIEKDDIQRRKIGKVRMLIHGKDFVFFFRYKKNIYGGSEDSRLTYSMIKDNHNYDDETMFSATNLNSVLEDDPIEDFFSVNEIDKIRILHKNVAEELLLKEF